MDLGSSTRFCSGDSDLAKRSGSRLSPSTRSSRSPSSPLSSPDSSASSASWTTLSKAALLRLQGDGDIPNLPKTTPNSDIEGFAAHVPYTVKNTFVHIRGDLSGAEELDNVSTASAPPLLLACQPVDPGEIVEEGSLHDGFEHHDLLSQLESDDGSVRETHSRSSIAFETTDADADLGAVSWQWRPAFLHMTQQSSRALELCDSSLSDSSHKSSYRKMIQHDNSQIVMGAFLAGQTTENDGFDQESLFCVSQSELMRPCVAGSRSVGSEEHESGRCKLCVFENKYQHFGKAKCWKGSLCDRCHEWHEPWLKPPRSRRKKLRAVISQLV